MNQRRYIAALLALLVVAACHHAPPPASVVATPVASEDDASFMKNPCQDLNVDDFGWRLDSLGGVRYRVYPELKSIDARTYLTRHYAAQDRQLYLELDMTPTNSNLAQFANDLTAPLRVECAVDDRMASVLVGRRNFSYETTVLWHDIGNGNQLRVTARARTLADMNKLRATLFTMQFPNDSSGH